MQVVFLTKKLHVAEQKQQQLQLESAAANAGEERAQRTKEFSNNQTRMMLAVRDEVKAREKKLQVKHQVEWESMDRQVAELKNKIPPMPAAKGTSKAVAMSDTQATKQTFYHPDTAKKVLEDPSPEKPHYDRTKTYAGKQKRVATTNIRKTKEIQEKTRDKTTRKT